MVFVEHQLTDYNQCVLFRDQDSEHRWLFRTNRKTKAQIALEEEIHALRCRLEQMVVEGRTMTSESVVEVSMLLDRKINEYMNKGKESR